ncbi:MAG: cytochrome b/b6 domain-containing protein [Rhodoferax sp.]|nr:cytochrome b/b6 domain-containing protein [Rhodoferax sp.]
MQTIRVWDLPTRVFHWALAAAVVGLVTTAQLGGAWMEWHMRLGYLVLSLILFRLVWGVVGGYWSRFGVFVPTPTHLLQYLRGSATPHDRTGHSPLGALSVLAMLLVVLAQVVSGLFSDDEIATSGPLSRFASGQWVGRASDYHTDVGKFLLVALVVGHIAAIAFYRFKKGHRLTAPMLHGDKAAPDGLAGARDTTTTRSLALGIWLVCAAMVALLVNWAQL